MSDLQIVLIILGVFIIAGVVIYNWLQERKLRNHVASDFIVPHKDVLTEDFYIDTDAYVEKELAEVSVQIKAHEQSKANQIADKLSANNDQQADNIAPKVPTKPIINPFSKANFDTQAVLIAQSTANSPNNAKITQEVNNTLVNSNVDIETKARAESNQYENIEVSIPSQTDVISETDDLSVRALKNPVDVTSNTLTSSAIDMLANKQTIMPNDLHAQIDLTAILFANKKIKSERLVSLAASLNDANLPIVMHGLDETDKWHLVSENTGESEYKQAACSMQMANRSGPINKAQLNKFQFAVENMGLELNAHVEWQGTGDALTNALTLDQFCIEVDQLINVHLAQNENPIHGTKLRGLAEASGLVLHQNGKFYYQLNDAAVFSMIEPNNQSFTAESLRSNVLKGVTFQLEIAKIQNSEQVFNQMILVAQKMASSLGARLVDDNQKALGDLQIEKIRQQLKIIHAKMVARGIMPGSPASLRLFS